MLYGAVVGLWRGTLDFEGGRMMMLMLGLFGGYALFGNRLSVKRGIVWRRFVLDAEDNPHGRVDKA